MVNPGSSSIETDIEFLEKVNELIDLCIDNGFYDIIQEMIPDDKITRPEIIKSLREMRPESKLVEDKRKFDDSVFKIGAEAYPIQQVSIIKCFSEIFLRKYSKNSILLEENEQFKPWSCLLWAKLIRAELHKQNSDQCLELYEDIITYLEANITLFLTEDAARKANKSWKITMLNYIMELSATSMGEASLGYAERARGLSNRILEEILTPEDKHKRKTYGHPYDRWIWFNKGIAYQHTQRHKEAIDYFHEVISHFFSNHLTPPDRQDLDIYLEFLLNIAPSILQTAEINLQGQLAYHATESENIRCMDDWIKKTADLYSKDSIFGRAANQIAVRGDLLRLEALLRLGDSYNNVPKIMKKLHQEIENNGVDDPESAYDRLPEYDLSRPSSLFRIRLMEQKVLWYREQTKELMEYLERDQFTNYIKNEDDKKIDILTSRMKAIEDQYWKWVQGNPQDRNVYFSNWARFLGMGMRVIRLLRTNDPPVTQEYNRLLVSIKSLYNARREYLPRSENGGEEGEIEKRKIDLQNLRSDDPYDIIGGLNDFYEGMINIKSDDNAGNDAKFYDQLKEDHFRFLKALDAWDRNFGEYQRIEELSRCNKRVKWFNPDDANISQCQKCFTSDEEKYGVLDFFKCCSYFKRHKQKNREGFSGLLKCCFESDTQKRRQSEQTDRLIDSDYDHIMSIAEDHFKKHLKDNSQHIPYEKSLHFMGLQRWNSLTPAQGKSVGGGYFVYHTDDKGDVDLGIVIDPGFDFVRNYFRQGFSIRDIDIVLISHAHPDHLWDFESIVQLLHDLSQKEKVKNRNHRINVILTKGVYQRYEHNVIENQTLRKFIEPLVIDLQHQEKDTLEAFSFRESSSLEKANQHIRWKIILRPPPDIERQNRHMDSNGNEIRKIEIEPTYAYHDDYSRVSDSYGFKIKFEIDNKHVCFGYTGDTKWVADDLYNENCPARNGMGCGSNEEECSNWKNVAAQYKDCDILLIHFGSLIDHKKGKKFENLGANQCVKLMRYKNHPYLPGMIRLIKGIQSKESVNKLILVGEFGEELRGGIRVDIIERLRALIPDKWWILPIDVGLDILLSTKKIREDKGQYEFVCAICEKCQPLDKICYERYGYDEAIFYVCQTCLKATPIDVLRDQFRKLYEIGKELKSSVKT